LLSLDRRLSYDAGMTREEAISRICANADAIRALGAARVYLYGSVARNAAGSNSDIDIFIDRDPERRFGFIELTELEFLLRDVLGTDVDLSTRTGLHPALSEAIEKDAIRVL
jgi:predicted nucleotidyltransferase